MATTPEQFTLVAGDGEEVSVGRQFLCRESGYIQGIIHSGMQESSETIFKLPALTSEGLQAVQQYSVSGDLSQSYLAKADDVILAVSYLQLDCMEQVYGRLLEQNLRRVKPFEILSLAERYSVTRLVEIVEKAICNDLRNNIFEDVSFKDVCRWLKRDDLYASECRILIEALLWLRSQTDEDVLKYARPILACVRFPLVVPSTNFKPEYHITNEAVIKLVKEEMTSGSDACNLHCRVRCPVQAIVICGGFTCSEQSTNRFQFLPLEEMMSTERSSSACFTPLLKGRLPSRLCEHSVAVVDGWLYVAGGQDRYVDDGKFTTAHLYRFCPGSLTWRKLAGMSVARSLFYLGAIGKRLYAVGGWIGPNLVSRGVEMYDTCTGVWADVAPLEIGLHEHAGCTMDNSLYVSGGYKGPQRGHLDRVFCFNAERNYWQECAPLVQARSYHQMQATKEHLYVFGGVNYIGDDTFEDVLSCEQYDPVANQWSVVSWMPRYGSCMPSVLVEGRYVLLMGGYSFQEKSGHAFCQILDIESMSWRQVAFNSNSILSFSATVMDIPRQYLNKEDIKTYLMMDKC